jgi:hypothetical protein
MLEQLRETARGVQSTLREAALLAEIEKLREAIEATEQSLAMQKHRLEQLARELQKEPGHLAKLAGTDAGATLVSVIRGMAGQPQHPAAPQQPPPQVIHVQQPRSGSARSPAPQTIRVQTPRAAAAPVQAAPVRPVPAAERVEEKPPAAPPAHEAAEAEVTHEAEVAPEADAAHEAAQAPPAASGAAPEPQDEMDAHEQLLIKAVETGRHALADLDHCVSQAQELARAGVWRIVKGMVSTRSPEHAKIDEVRSRAHEVQELLGSFEHQVRGLHDQFGHRVDVADLKGFAKRFAAALAAGPQEEHLGHRATEAARAAYHDVRRMCTRLQLDAIALRAKRAAAQRSGRK